MDTKASGKIKKHWLSLAGRDWPAFGRADYLAAKIILGIAVVGAVLFGLIGPVVDTANNTPLQVSYFTRVNNGFELPRGTTHDGNAKVSLQLKDATVGERFDQALPGFLLAGLTIGVAWLIFQLLRDIQAKEPFTRRSVRRLNLIALIVLIGGTLVPFVQGFADSSFSMTGRIPNPPTLTFELSVPPWPLIAVVVILLVGEAFRRGVELRDDVEGLI